MNQFYIHIYLFFTIFFSIMVYYRILNIVPCAIQDNLVYFILFCFIFKFLLAYS